MIPTKTWIMHWERVPEKNGSSIAIAMNLEQTMLVDCRISKVTAAAEPVGSSIAIAMSLEQIVSQTEI